MKENEKLALEYLASADEYQYKKRNFDVASLHYQIAIHFNPSLLEALNNYAQNLRLNDKDYKKAIEFYTRVIEIDPQYEYAYLRRGLCKGAMGDFHGQIKDYSEAINQTDKLDYYISRALIKFKINDYDGVITDCSYVIEKSPKDYHVYGYRGRAYISKNMLKEALRDLDYAIELFESISITYDYVPPFSHGIYRDRAYVHLQSRRLLDSLKDFLTIVEKAPNHPLAYRLSAHIYKKLDNTTMYSKMMNKFKELDYKWKDSWAEWKYSY